MRLRGKHVSTQFQKNFGTCKGQKVGKQRIRDETDSRRTTHSGGREGSHNYSEHSDLEDHDVAPVVEDDGGGVGGVLKDEGLIRQVELHWQPLRDHHAQHRGRRVDLYVQCFEVIAFELSERLQVALRTLMGCMLVKNYERIGQKKQLSRWIR